MRRFLTWLGVAAGAMMIFKWRFRRRRPEPAPAVDPADELKRKLAETRVEEPAAESEPEELSESLAERRRAVHDKARAAIDDMLGGENLPGEETD